MSAPKLNPLSMSPADAARLLSKAGGEPVSEDEILATVRSGAPALPNGNINIIHLGAWLMKELNDDD